jgi:basic membrane lipoprotein Med (substrate-binding protein (PBP1-ABC) superfamily)
MMRKRSTKMAALAVSAVLVVAACGGDDDSAPAAEPAAEEPAEEPVEEPAEEPAAEPAEEPVEEPAEEPEVDELVAAFDANGDGTLTIGVAAAGPRDDEGYYQSLVDFAENFSAENGFAPPIVSDMIGAEEAAQKMSDLAQQGVDIIFVGASEIAEPLPDLTEQYPDIFWYCNCGAGFPELPGLAQATDWGAAIHYTAGVAMGQTLVEQGSTKSVWLGCCELNFEIEAFEAIRFGMQSVDPSLDMEFVSTGDFPFDFDNAANATAALSAAAADGATLAYAYLGGGLNPVGQLATELGVSVFAAGPADICSRDDGINWTGSVVFDGGLYAAQAIRLILSGELTEGTTFQFPTEVGLNGMEVCDPSAETEAALANAFGLLASYDGDLMGALGAISGAAYSG